MQAWLRTEQNSESTIEDLRYNLEENRSKGHAISEKVKGKVSQRSYDNTSSSQNYWKWYLK